MSDLEWKLFEDIFSEEKSKRCKGMPHAPYRHVLNSLLYILITGCRWCDLSLFCHSPKTFAISEF
ncbi:MAG: transposase [Nostoc sp.]